MTQTGRVLWASTLFALALIALATRPAAAGVEVVFLAPEGYTDAARTDGGKADPGTLQALARHLQRLGARNLKANQNLTIEVLDIDLAGRFEPWRATATNVRFLRSITWPSIRMRYSLSEDGRVMTTAEETVSDQTYDMRGLAASAGDPLRYEKAMLGDWFSRRFASH